MIDQVAFNVIHEDAPFTTECVKGMTRACGANPSLENTRASATACSITPSRTKESLSRSHSDLIRGPLTATAWFTVLAETILGPIQAALLILAVRRRFMR